MLYFVTPFLKGQPIILKYNKGMLVTKVSLDVPKKISFSVHTLLVFGTIQRERFYAEEIFSRGFFHTAQFVKTWCASNGFYTANHPAWNGLIFAEKITTTLLRNKLKEAKKMYLQAVEGLLVRKDQPTKNVYTWGAAGGNIEKICNRYAAAASCGRIR